MNSFVFAIDKVENIKVQFHFEETYQKNGIKESLLSHTRKIITDTQNEVSLSFIWELI